MNIKLIINKCGYKNKDGYKNKNGYINIKI